MIKILVIEDDLPCANLITRTLQMHGVETKHAADGLLGLQLAREFAPDAILVDINLPDLDGKVVALQLRKLARYEQMSIIAVTAMTGEKMRRIAINFGCNDLISKPIDPSTFPDQVFNIMKASGKLLS